MNVNIVFLVFTPPPLPQNDYILPLPTKSFSSTAFPTAATKNPDEVPLFSVGRYH